MEGNIERLKHLKQNIIEELDLIKDFEDKKRLENDPKESRRCDKAIDEARKKIAQHQQEIEALENSLVTSTISRYLSYIIECNEDLTPRGMREAQHQISLQLDEIYVALKASREHRNRNDFDQLRHNQFHIDENADEWVPTPRSLGRGRFHTNDRSTNMDLSQIVREHSHLVILGDPGAGKTTLMRFLARRFALAARENASEVHDNDGNLYGTTRLPILLRIAAYAEDFSKNRNLRLRDFLHSSSGNLFPSSEVIEQLFWQKLERGEALVLFDGLDEVIDPSDRILISSQIEDFVAAVNCNNLVIVTSRPVGYREAPLGGQFEHFTIQDLEPDQIKKFLNRWCHATERFLGKDISANEVDRRATTEIQAILRAINENIGVQRLATNPLLLTIIARVHRDGAHLPSRRVDLYRIATEALLRDWQLARNTPTRVVDEDEAMRFLWPLAYWMHKNKSTGLATEQEIKERLAEFLAHDRKTEPDNPDIIAAINDFLRRIHENTGILVAHAPGRYGFMHLTFEEYFAARELVRRSKNAARRIYEMRHLPRWEEPIRIAIAQRYSPDDASDLIRSAILAENDETENSDFKPSPHENILHRDLLLSAQCISDCIAVDANLQQQIVDRLISLYLDVEGACKYTILRLQIARCLSGFRGTRLVNNVLQFLKRATFSGNMAAHSGAVEALGEIKTSTPEIISALLSSLRNENAIVRKSAATTLGKIKANTPEIASALLLALCDEDASNRSAAASALGEIEICTPEVTQALLECLKDENADVRKSAASALGKIKANTPEVVSALVSYLKDEIDTHLDVLFFSPRLVGSEITSPWRPFLIEMVFTQASTAASALEEIKTKTPEVISALLSSLRDEDAAMRRAGAFALGRIKANTPEVISALLSSLHDEDASVRRQGIFALRNINATAPEVTSALLSSLHDENAKVRRAMVFTLAEGDVTTPEIISALLSFLRDEDGHVRIIAAFVLGEKNANTPKTISALLECLHDKEANVISMATFALGKLKANTPEVVLALLSSLRDEDTASRSAAVSALGEIEICTPEVTQALLECLKDENADVRKSAASALGKIKTNTPEVTRALLNCLQDKDEDVPSAAAMALGEIKASTPDIVSALLSLLLEGNVDMHRAAASALEEIDATSPETISALLECLSDEDVDIRNTTLDVLVSICKKQAHKLTTHTKEQISAAVLSALETPERFKDRIMRDYRMYQQIEYFHAYDALWEMLWLLS